MIWFDSVRYLWRLFLAIFLGILLIDFLTPYTDMGAITAFLLSTVFILPSMISYYIKNSIDDGYHWLPGVIILAVGVLMSFVLFVGCDTGRIFANCYGGIAGPSILLGMMVSWGAVTLLAAHEAPGGPRG